MRPATIQRTDAAKLFPAAKLFQAIAATCLCINITVAIWAAFTRPVLNSDFRGLWSFAKFAREQPVKLIYQAPALQAFQQQIFPAFRSFFPFQYPPSFLLPLWPLGAFDYPAAQAVWSLAGLAAMIAAALIAFPLKQRWFSIFALLAAPASLLNGIGGETGYFTTAMLLAGFAWLPSRPVLAGIAFGVLTLKPQLGWLVPLALLARRDYRAFASACLVALAFAAISCGVFPAKLWLDWLRALPAYQAQYAAAKALSLNADISLAGNLVRMGAAAGTGWAAQALAGLAGAGAVFFAFRRAPYPIAVAVLLTGTCLCAPHARVYDSIPLTAAILLTQPQTGILMALCLVIYLSPYLLLTGAGAWFLYAFPETLLFLAIIYLALTPERTAHTRHEPVIAAKFDPKQR
jgi:hypothetical protein